MENHKWNYGLTYRFLFYGFGFMFFRSMGLGLIGLMVFVS